MVVMTVTGGFDENAENEETIARLLKPPTNKSTRVVTLYLVAFGTIFGIGFASILAVLILRPDQDNSVLIGGVISLMGTFMGSVFVLLKSQDETHKLVNSEMEEFRKVMRMAMVGKLEMARLQGAADGSTRADERNEKREDKIADTLAKAGAELVTVGKEKLAEIKHVTEGIHDTTKDTQQTVHKIAEVLPVKKET